MNNVIQYKNFYIHTGTTQAPDDFPAYWAEVWFNEKPLYRWYGASSFQMAVNWVKNADRNYRQNNEEQALA